MLNQRSVFDNTVLDEISQWDEATHMSQPPFVAEVRCTIQQMSYGKSPSVDSIPSEMRSTSMAVNNCFNVSRSCVNGWDQEAVPQDFKDARIVHIQVKGKPCCDNHRGISLLSIAGKIIARTVRTDYRYTTSTTG